MADWSGAEAYARSFGLLCAGAVHPLLDLVEEEVPAGLLVDVGSGPGTLAAAAAARGWTVRAVEPDAAMRTVSRRAAPWLDPAPGALPGLPLPDGAVDVAAANFVVNHLPDPRAGVRDLARVTRPGGVVAVSVWATAANALSGLWDRVIDAAGVTRPTGVRLDAAKDFARSEEGLAGLLDDAGLVDVRVTSAVFDFDIAPEPLWASAEAGLGVIGATWRAQSDAGRAAMATAFEAEAHRRARPDGLLRFGAAAPIGRGTVPDPGR